MQNFFRAFAHDRQADIFVATTRALADQLSGFADTLARDAERPDLPDVEAFFRSTLARVGPPTSNRQRDSGWLVVGPVSGRIPADRRTHERADRHRRAARQAGDGRGRGALRCVGALIPWTLASWASWNVTSFLRCPRRGSALHTPASP